MTMMTYDLTPLRAAYTASLTTPGHVRRKQVDADGLSTGDYDDLPDTYCAINSAGGGSSNPFINSLMQQITAKTPGARTLSFSWDEDVRTGDFFVTAEGTYKLGLVSTDDPVRIGLQVEAEVQRVP